MPAETWRELYDSCSVHVDGWIVIPRTQVVRHACLDRVSYGLAGHVTPKKLFLGDYDSVRRLTWPCTRISRA
ncbi:hypothetical protein BHE74_00023831 [Ensete ventricosum]|nr:hypothetical protein BHE74_00023831 [Ensete ventricosum]RZR90207.1 hypothetical protein BHM03_00018054 [Ensete ventricosum]